MTPDPDLNKTQQDMRPPRLSWYEQRRPPVGDDKSTTITLNWAKVGPMIGLTVFIGGLVTTSVNAAVSVAQYKARIEASDRKLEEQQARIARLEEKLTRLEITQVLVDRLQGRVAALEEDLESSTPPAFEAPTERYPRTARRGYAGSQPAAVAMPE